MPNRRRERYEDRRLDWRDPQMPVYRGYHLGNGRFVEFADPDYERRYREHKMEVERVERRYPDWRNDPTYNLRRKK